ncbi:MAG TPA: TlpA disulfide reductase family protein, partial [Candidatus Limnocylindrales bacterium]
MTDPDSSQARPSPVRAPGVRRVVRGGGPSRRPVLVALALAVVATVVIVGVVAVVRPKPAGTTPGISKGAPAPAITGTTLDGTSFDLASLRGRPVIVNFWGPSCVPCRDEFPLFKQELAAHEADGLAIVGILTYDGPDDARAFIAQYGATWPTVQDPTGAIRTTYRVVGRPQSYFIDRDGVLREISVGQVTEQLFATDYGLISGGATGSTA